MQRGYALVRTKTGALVRNAKLAATQATLNISFADGELSVTPSGAKSTTKPKPKSKPKKKTASKSPAASKTSDQGSLF